MLTLKFSDKNIEHFYKAGPYSNNFIQIIKGWDWTCNISNNLIEITTRYDLKFCYEISDREESYIFKSFE